MKAHHKEDLEVLPSPEAGSEGIMVEPLLIPLVGGMGRNGGPRSQTGHNDHIGGESIMKKGS